MNDLKWENALVLDLVQALIGTISPNIRRVSLGTMSGSAQLQFVLENDSIEDREEISDVEFEFTALQDLPIHVNVSIIVSDLELSELPALRRTVYGRRES